MLPDRLNLSFEVHRVVSSVQDLFADSRILSGNAVYMFYQVNTESFLS